MKQSTKPDKPEPKSGSCLPAITKRGFIVSGLRIHQVGRIIFLVFIFFNMAEARDLSTLQSAVTYAREDMEKAKTKHEGNERALTQQKQIVDERKKQLDKAQKDVILSEKQYLDAQKKYQKAQSTLDQAWNKK